ncbi:MAG TPA: hypothetical protein VJ180_04065 [Pyrinomonadaceae bacterium]|nr:hypothetical protein [Pyrinomonadaceae bacterium]
MDNQIQIAIAGILQAPWRPVFGIVEMLVVALVVVAVLYFGYKAAKETPNKMWVWGHARRRRRCLVWLLAEAICSLRWTVGVWNSGHAGCEPTRA